MQAEIVRVGGRTKGAVSKHISGLREDGLVVVLPGDGIYVTEDGATVLEQRLGQRVPDALIFKTPI